jgi:Lsr2
LARATITQLTDDLDGTEAVEEVTFTVRGTEYEIDLNAKNVAAFDKALERFIKAARTVRRARPSRTVATARSSSRSRSDRSTRRDNPTEIREWARSAGHEISNRGRISASIREAYRAAQA